jgi:hypothetical protein
LALEKLRLPLLVLLAGWFVTAYAPGIGTGFIKDDFAWLQQSRVESVSDAVAVFSHNTGFYRPLVTLSFAADRALFGLAPLGYGWTNALLVLLVGIAIARLARALGLSPVAGIIAAGLWVMNPHGINSALLWTSGRTSLLLTWFAVLAATTLVRRRLWQTAGFVLLALLSKEEAVALPVILLAWTFLLDRRAGTALSRVRPLAWTALALFAPLLAYLVLRSHSGAFTPSSAPPFYHASTDPGVLAFNVFSYLDRSATFSLAVALAVMLAVRRRPHLDRDSYRLIAMCAIWFAGGYALTVWLPSRSSLYVCLPSVGVVLIAAMWLSRLVERARRVALVPTVAVLFAVTIVAMPIWWSRNERLLVPARVSAAVLPQLTRVVASQPAGTTIVIKDGENPLENIAIAFGAMLPEAVALTTGRWDVRLWLVPPPLGWQSAGWQPPSPGTPTVHLTLHGLVLRPTAGVEN